MAIDFNSGTGSLFYRLGRILHIPFVMETYQATLPAAFDDLGDEYEASLQAIGGAVSLQADALTRVSSGVMGFAVSAAGRPNAAWDTIVRTVYDDQPTQSWTRQAAMAEVIRQMEAQGKTVKENIITCTATVLPNGTGDGVIIVSTLRSDGIVQENTVDETLRITCTTDSYSGTATAGQEQFTLVGSPVIGSVWDYDYPTGSAANVGINAISCSVDATAGNNLLTNSDFEDWTGVTPALSDWTLEVGTWGTSIQQSTDEYEGDFAVRFNAGATLNALYQEFDSTTGTEGTVSSLSTYAVNFWIKRDGVVTTGVLTVELVDDTGTVITDDAAVANSYTITLSGLTTSYAASNRVFRLPKNPPDVIRIRFRISTVLAGANVLIDGLAFAEMTPMYTGGPVFTVFSGVVPFVGGDGWGIVNTNDYGGSTFCATFQTGFQRLFDMRSMGMLLPSATSPNISNTLITA